MADYASFKKINSAMIADGAITGSIIGTSQITLAKINNNAVATADIADGNITTAELANPFNIGAKTVTYRPFINSDLSNTAAVAGSKLASGAIATNLGSTPLGKSTAAGATMTGTLGLAAGTAAAPSLTISGDTDTGIYFPAADQIAFSTNGTAALVIDSSGRGIEPNRPAFHGAGTGGWYYHGTFGYNGWREININWQITQQGGSNAASNGRFTAPVAGYYWFYAQSYYYSDDNGTPSYTHWNIGRNGAPQTSVNSRHPHTIFAHGLPNNHAPGIMTAVEFYMNAGDFSTLQPYLANGPGRIHGDHSLWCGFLIG